MTETPPDWVTQFPNQAVHTAPSLAGGPLTAPFTQDQLVNMRDNFFEGFLRQVLLALNGVWVQGIDAFDQLRQWAVDELNQLAAVIDDLLGGGHGVRDFVEWLEHVLRWDSPLDAGNLFGDFDLSSLSNQGKELLWRPNFTGPDSVAAGSRWTYDDQVYRAGGWVTKPGSVRVDADGTATAMRSNTGEVSRNQMIDASVHVLAAGLTGTGDDLLELQLIPYHRVDDDTLIAGDFLTIATSGVPTDTPDDWVDAPAGATAGKLSAAWPIPDDPTVAGLPAGTTVDEVGLRIGITEHATAGTIWWDSASQRRNVDWDRVVADFDAIFALFTHLDDPQAWSDAWDALVDLLRMVGIELTPGKPDGHGFLAAVQEIGDAFVNLIWHLADPDAWTRGADALKTVLNYFVDVDAWGHTQIGLFTATQELGDAFWNLIRYIGDPAAWTRASLALKGLLGFFVDTSGWGDVNIGLLTALHELGDAVWNLIGNLFSALAWTRAANAIKAVLAYFLNTSSWGDPPANPLAAIDSKTQNLTASGTLGTNWLTGMLGGSQVQVPGWGSLNSFAGDVNAFMSEVFGKLSGRGSGNDYMINTNRTERLPNSLLSNARFTGNGVQRTAGGGLKFTEPGWYSFVVSIQFRNSAARYIASCLLLDASDTIFLEGQAYSNVGSTFGAFHPVLQCNGLVRIDTPNAVYYPGYSITLSLAATVWLKGDAGSGQLYISATKLK